MDKEFWNKLSDEEKTTFMKNSLKALNLENFDYAKARELYERMTEPGSGTYGVYKNPCLVLELVDPVMAPAIMGWLYAEFDDKGNRIPSNSPGGHHVPLFGYNLVELTFDKSSLMNFSDTEKQILREAMNILQEHTKREEESYASV